MFQTLRPLFLSLLSLLLVGLWGCGAPREGGAKHSAPHLMNDATSLRGIAHPSASTAARRPDGRYPRDAALELRRLEMEHQERLAAIEAEKAKAIERFKAQQARTLEELRSKTKALEAQAALRLAQEKRRYAALLARKETTIKALEANASLHRDQTQKAIATLSAQSKLKVTELTGRYETAIAQIQAQLSQRRTWILLGAFLILLLALFAFYRYRKKLEEAHREAQRRHEAQMLEQRMRHEHIEKVLEIIASESTDESVKIELARLLQSGLSTDDPRLLEYRPEDSKSTPPSDEKGEKP